MNGKIFTYLFVVSINRLLLVELPVNTSRVKTDLLKMSDAENS